MRLILVCLLLFFSCFRVGAQTDKLQALLDSIRTAGNFPGLSLAIVTKQDGVISLSSGYNDRDKKILLKTSDRFLHGSVGKTYASAVALRLIKQGRINLDEKVAAYLGKNDWYHRIPNAANITVRMLMNHTSGVMRYEFKDQFLKDLAADPAKTWQPAELVRYVLDEKASFEAGTGWEYADTNYILLGMIMEQVTGQKYYDLLRKEILQPYQLYNTFPQDGRKLQGLAQGYAGVDNEFGGKDKVLNDDGAFIINPQFEWTGGGVFRRAPQ